MAVGESSGQDLTWPASLHCVGPLRGSCLCTRCPCFYGLFHPLLSSSESCDHGNWLGFWLLPHWHQDRLAEYPGCPRPAWYRPLPVRKTNATVNTVCTGDCTLPGSIILGDGSRKRSQEGPASRGEFDPKRGKWDHKAG